MIALLFATALAAEPLAAEPLHPTARDVASYGWVGQPELSPDGTRLLYSLEKHEHDGETEGDADMGPVGGWTSTEQVWLVDLSTGEAPLQITRGDQPATAPQWSADGMVVSFLRPDHDGRARIHLLSAGWGEAQKVDTGDLEPTAYAWAPEGRRLAFIATPPDEDDDDWASGGAIHWDQEWRSDRLYVVDTDGGEPTEVVVGDVHVVDFEWSPDGRRMLVAHAPSSDPYEVFRQQSLAVVRVAGERGGRVISDEPGCVAGPRFSPDGEHAAWMACDGTLSLDNALMVADIAERRTWNAADALDPTIGAFTWSADGRSLVVHVLERTRSKLYRVPRDGGSAKELGLEGRVIESDFSVDKRGRKAAVVTSSATEPHDPTIIDLRTGSWELAARVHPDVEGWSLGRTEVVHWKNAEGTELEGLLLHPPAYEGEGAPPLMVMPHGGPDGVSLERFSRWAHYHAARGYAVFMPNYRGGLAYGREFYASNRGRLGEVELADIESGVDHLVAQGVADADRLVYGGWSWGGYLAAWTIGHTDRYKAAVAGAPVVDTFSSYALSDVNHGIAAGWEYRGNPWQQPENFDRASPARFLVNAKTPTLVLQGEEDRRVPFGQGVTLYRALSDLGVEVEFWAYPGEGHSFYEPAHTEHMLERWTEWYARHLEQE